MKKAVVTEIVEYKKYKSGELSHYLRSLGLPSSKPSIWLYEKAGIIPSPRSSNPLHSTGTFKNAARRSYYGSEILEIVKIIRGIEDGTDTKSIQKFHDFLVEYKKK